MSGELNKLFTKGPIPFLKTTPLGCAGKLEGENMTIIPKPGKYKFDLSHPTSEDKAKARTVDGLALLRLCTQRGNDADDAIDAYWLGWEVGSTTQITLGNEAPYFFTSALDGCRIQIAGNTIFHIAPEVKNPINVVKDAVGPIEAVRSRQVNEADYGKLGFFAGVLTDKTWKFVIQRKEIVSNKVVLKDAKEILGGTVNF